ncbi:MAG: hypothetical protein KDB79_05895 [Acidobacteria bacterium]|nr:hypothetical protein [Acidobacteriota bacterium]
MFQNYESSVLLTSGMHTILLDEPPNYRTPPKTGMHFAEANVLQNSPAVN